jgi:uncharacterized protein (DUF2141 family)
MQANKHVSMRRHVPFAMALGLLSASLLATAPAGAQEANLFVQVKGIRAAVGNLRVSLYSDAETFRKEDRALKLVSIPAAEGDATLEFKGLAPGRYALMAYHDENSDDKLNLRFGMLPIEGYALSNAPKSMGPPKFVDSAFDIAGPETRVSLPLSY